MTEPERTGRPSRKEREQARHREDILGAAERLLAQKPYSSITMQEVAAEAEFSVGYLYKFFEGKEDLYWSLIEVKKQDLAVLMRGILEGPDSYEKKLDCLVHGFFEWLQRNPAYVRSNLQDMKELAKRRLREDARRGERMSMERPLLEFFRAASQDGEVERGREVEMAMTLRALMWGFIEDDIHPDTKDWTEYAPIIIRIMRRAYAPRD